MATLAPVGHWVSMAWQLGDISHMHKHHGRFFQRRRKELYKGGGGGVLNGILLKGSACTDLLPYTLPKQHSLYGPQLGPSWTHLGMLLGYIGNV